MRRNLKSIGIEQGSRVLFNDFAHDGAMWSGTGPREVRHAHLFDTPFLDAPAVMIGVTMWDIDHKTNSRADISAESVTALGFEIVFRTWGDTHVARIRADWMAIGQTRDDDDWEVA
ncbi:MAG: H-type lectin domain-containing protein [Rhodobacterales bacterium]|nr:H-type lectin domain-containing protein [Rhodobacterales bacterium]